MTEELLYYLWESRLIPHNILTTNGEKIEIVHPGERNRDSGPDFFNARIILQNVTWAGNVEIHVNSSDWYHHNHHEDTAFDNILLHVVYNYDRPVFRNSGEEIPCIEIKRHVKQNVIDRYDYLVRNRRSISCEGMTSLFPDERLKDFLDRAGQARFIQKSDTVRGLATYYGNDHQQLFYILMFRAFGMNTNTLPFELLAKSIPFKILQRHSDQLFILEALLFGQAGMLSGESKDDYQASLKSEYEFFSKKYQLSPIDAHLWKFSKVRPGNFPTIRIAQLAALMHQHPELYHIINDASHAKDWIQSVEIVSSPYWEKHYLFAKSTKERSAMMGSSMIDNLLINCIIPFLLYLSEWVSDHSSPLTILRELPPEENREIRIFRSVGINPGNALESQALIGLKKHFCDNKRCLDCEIGRYILNK